MSVMKYRDTTPTVDLVLKELGADYILVGSVRRSGGRVRITTQLIETREGTHLGAEIMNASWQIFSYRAMWRGMVSRWRLGAGYAENDETWIRQRTKLT